MWAYTKYKKKSICDNELKYFSKKIKMKFLLEKNFCSLLMHWIFFLYFVWALNFSISFHKLSTNMFVLLIESCVWDFAGKWQYTHLFVELSAEFSRNTVTFMVWTIQVLVWINHQMIVAQQFFHNLVLQSTNKCGKMPFMASSEREFAAQFNGSRFQPRCHQSLFFGKLQPIGV